MCLSELDHPWSEPARPSISCHTNEISATLLISCNVKVPEVGTFKDLPLIFLTAHGGHGIAPTSDVLHLELNVECIYSRLYE